MDAHYPSLSVGSTETKACQVDQKHFISTCDIFFLEHAGELYIISLEEESTKDTPTHTTPQGLGN
jgi:hypothetical protein